MSKGTPTTAPEQKSSLHTWAAPGAWLLAVAAVGIAFVAWASNSQWHFTDLNIYRIFPLLGLAAFSIMWSHYMVGTLQQLLQVPGSRFKNYYRYTGYTVLALICLHPGLLIFQRFQDGYGLPPGSYESYVAPGLGWVTLLGTVSLIVFLAYEFGRFFSKRPWWHFVTEAGDLAMLAILYHGFRLGAELQFPIWYKYVWLFYAITLVLVLIRSYKQTYFTKNA